MDSPNHDARRTAGLAAQALAEVCDLVDLQLSPLGLRAIDALSPKLGDVVIDVGCGAGQSVLQLADRVGPDGRVIGLDIAPLLLDIARRRAAALPQVRFVEGDAQTIGLPRQGADGVFSRFGVMAFVDPVLAFTNFHRMMRCDGRLVFVCWRSLEENELDFLPLRAAGLEDMVDLTPFSFADAGYLRAMLEQAGFRGVAIEAYDAPVSNGDSDAMAAVLLKVGALGRILREHPDLRTAAEPRLRAVLGERREHGRVALNAATWIVSART